MIICFGCGIGGIECRSFRGIVCVIYTFGWGKILLKLFWIFRPLADSRGNGKVSNRLE